MTLTPEMVERERRTFETWALDEAFDIRCDSLHDGYRNEKTDAAWDAWQEARAQSQRAVGVEELEALAASLDERCRRAILRHPTAPYADSFGHAADALRALIERAGGGV